MGKDHQDHQACYNKIWEQKRIAKLLSVRDKNGLLIDKMDVFAEFGLSRDARLDKNAEYSLDVIRGWKKQDVDVYACYTPSRLRALVMLGYCDDNVKDLINEFAATQLSDGGFMCNRLLSRKPNRKSCYKAAVPALLLYAECKRKNILPANTENLITYFLKRDIFYSSNKTENLFFFKDGSPKFGKFAVPLIVYAMSILGAGNAREMQTAWNMLNQRIGENGRCRLDGSAKQAGVFGKDGQENKWATFYCLLAEKWRNGKE
jgi:hypothetical protein